MDILVFPEGHGGRTWGQNLSHQNDRINGIGTSIHPTYTIKSPRKSTLYRKNE